MAKSKEELAREDKERQDLAAAAAMQAQQPVQQPREVIVKKGKDGSKEINPLPVYTNWVKEYKKTHPEFKEDENRLTENQNGSGYLIEFSDPNAEENFVRELARTYPNGGGIFDKGILIAKFEDGKLIDPRTKNEFPEGEYAHLVSQLDSGIKYGEAKKMESPETMTDVIATELQPLPQPLPQPNDTNHSLGNGPEPKLG